MTEYRIEYSIQRQEPGEEDFTEIGFGSSGAHVDLDSAAYAVESDVQNGIWETKRGQPSPDEIVRAIQDEKMANDD
jgi:hypothetical protein